jgi:hypothetical protein
MFQMMSCHDREETIGMDQGFDTMKGMLQHRSRSDKIDVLFRKILSPQTPDKRLKPFTFPSGQYDSATDLRV